MNPLEKRIEAMSDAELKRVFKALDAKYDDHTNDERTVWDHCFDAAWQRDIIRLDDDHEVIYNPNK